MTRKEKYREYLKQLQQIYTLNESAVITDLVFESVAALPREDIIKNPGQSLDPETLTRLNTCLSALLQHQPVQYVLGEAWFCNMKLTVNEQVLIPRPETEELVQLVVASFNTVSFKQPSAISKDNISAAVEQTETGYRLSMLDVGTGSGCIAIAIKKKLPAIIMHAIDVSAGALLVARENAINQQVEIKFLKLDFLDKKSWHHLSLFDVIISNPPYIPHNEKISLDKNVSDFEPHTALFVPDSTPLIFYEKIAAFGKEHLSEHGKIYVEMHEKHSSETAAVFSLVYKEVNILKDIFGKERMIIAAYPKKF